MLQDGNLSMFTNFNTFVMKKILALLIIFISVCSVKSQQADYYSYTLRNDTPLRAKIFYNSLINIGVNNDINVDSMLYGSIVKNANRIYRGNIKANSSVSWLLSPLITIIDNKNDADVVISGTYLLEKNNNITEKVMYETSSKYVSQIPYFEVESVNEVNLVAIINYQYVNNTVVDTIVINFDSKRGPRTKQKSLAKLVSNCEKELGNKLYYKFDFIKRTVHNYKFTKVKVKDKSLKEEYKSAKNFLKDGHIVKLGSFYKKAYEESGSKEAAYCLGICYELAGNYPKALEYYKQMPDFHTKTRMKNSMKLYNYLSEMGVKLQVENF